MFDHQGPKELIIPEQKFLSCTYCKYYKHHLVRSGMDPIYANTCTHPEVDKICSFYRGNLQENHLNIVETPDWCPYIKEK